MQQASDMVKFRMVWWFKHHGAGSKEPINMLLLNISELCIDSKKSKFQRSEAWIPPLNSDLKFNVDGSSLGNPGPAGIGGVLRDSMRKVLCMFSFFVGSQDSNSAELMAIHKAVVLYCSSPACLGRFVDVIT